MSAYHGARPALRCDPLESGPLDGQTIPGRLPSLDNPNLGKQNHMWEITFAIAWDEPKARRVYEHKRLTLIA